MSLKTMKAVIANFNITFGEDERPMLDYFDNIIFPAITSNVVKKSNDIDYFIKNVSLLQNNDEHYYLVGYFIKKTFLEIKSDLTDNGELIEKNDLYSTAPYSIFAINLFNHRMLYVKNQKGSPSLTNFSSMISFLIKNFVKIHNKSCEDKDFYPNANINIIGIPSPSTVYELFENIEKVNSLTLRFYPLNGDLDLSRTFDLLANDLRKTVDSKNGEIILKTPKSVEGVSELINGTAGTVKPIIKGITKDNIKVTYYESHMTEICEIELDDDLDTSKKNKAIIRHTEKIKTLQYKNNNHFSIYNQNLNRIKKVLDIIRGENNR